MTNEEKIKDLEKTIEELQLNLKSRNDLVEELTMQIEKMKNYCSCEYCIHIISGDEFTVENTNKTVCEYCMDNNKKLWKLAE